MIFPQPRFAGFSRRVSPFDFLTDVVRSSRIAHHAHPKSGAKATAVQTLRDCRACPDRAKRLECGAFTAAFGRREWFLHSHLLQDSVAGCPRLISSRTLSAPRGLHIKRTRKSVLKPPQYQHFA